MFVFWELQALFWRSLFRLSGSNNACSLPLQEWGGWRRALKIILVGRFSCNLFLTFPLSHKLRMSDSNFARIHPKNEEKKFALLGIEPGTFGTIAWRSTNSATEHVFVKGMFPTDIYFCEAANCENVQMNLLQRGVLSDMNFVKSKKACSVSK